jgi:hypothetical protein
MRWLDLGRKSLRRDSEAEPRRISPQMVQAFQIAHRCQAFRTAPTGPPRDLRLLRAVVLRLTHVPRPQIPWRWADERDKRRTHRAAGGKKRRCIRISDDGRPVPRLTVPFKSVTSRSWRIRFPLHIPGRHQDPVAIDTNGQIAFRRDDKSTSVHATPGFADLPP